MLSSVCASLSIVLVMNTVFQCLSACPTWAIFCATTGDCCKIIQCVESFWARVATIFAVVGCCQMSLVNSIQTHPWQSPNWSLSGKAHYTGVLLSACVLKRRLKLAFQCSMNTLKMQ